MKCQLRARRSETAQLFLITAPDALVADTFLSVLRLQLGIVSAEVDLQGQYSGGQRCAALPARRAF